MCLQNNLILAWDADPFFHTASKRGQGIMQQQDDTYCFGGKIQTKYQILMINRKQRDSPESLHRQILTVPLRDLTPPSNTNSVKADLIFLLNIWRQTPSWLDLRPSIHGPATCKSQVHCFDWFLSRKRPCAVTAHAWQSEHTSDLCQRAEV